MAAEADLPDAALLGLVCRLNADYARTLDDDRLEAWPAFFVENCLYKITSADNHRHGLEAGLIYADSRGMLLDRVTALREANIYERQAYRHLIGTPAIVDRSGEVVRTEAPFLVVRIMRDGSMDLFATGRYLDLLVVDGSGLRIQERLVVCDSSRVDTLLAIPL
jgi:anthranilate 1,2-dioxygenase small subunit